MSNIYSVFEKQAFSSLTLEQLFNTKQSIPSSGFAVEITSDALLVAHSCDTFNNKCNQSSTSNTAVQAFAHELVVMSTMPVNVFMNLLSQLGLSQLTLSAINYRINMCSFRFKLTCENIAQARQILTQFSNEYAFEAALLEDAPSLSEPGLLVMDMDSTTIQIECIDEIAALAGVGQQVAEVTELAMQGKLDFSESLYQRVGTLTNAPISILADVAKNIPLMPGLETLITELKKHNWRVAIASGGFTFFADHLQQMLGLDATFANELEIVDNKLTGRVLGTVVDANVKAEKLVELSKQYNINHKQTVAMGDGANDLIMMKAAGLGVAFHAKDIVKQQADSAINNQGLDFMLHWLA